MSYRTVLFAIDEDPLAEAHVDHAARLARAFEGRLVGLSCHRPTPWPSDGVVAFIEGDPLTIELRAAEEAAIARETVFLQRCRLSGLTASDAILDTAEMASAVCRHAMFADLVVMAQPPSAGPHHVERLRRVHAVLQDSIRPVLLLPRAGQFTPPAGTALVAWDGSASAARAASAALPLLRCAKGVQLVQVFDPRLADGAALQPGLERAAGWLSGHGVAACAQVLASSLPAADALIAEAARGGAELLVMGAWGHRRVVERLLGGATRTMVEEMTVPVLFAH
jgi:nucleotide-binding universal stress UspA family protein